MPNDVEQSDSQVRLVACYYEWECPTCDDTRWEEDAEAGTVYCQVCTVLYPVKSVHLPEIEKED